MAFFMTEAQSYYLSLDAAAELENNVSRSDKSLVINCTGYSILTSAFNTHVPQGRADFYLQYLVRGEMDVIIDGQLFVMKPGQAITYYPHTEYQYSMHNVHNMHNVHIEKCEEAEENEIHYYWIHFTGSDAAALVEDCRLQNKAIMDIGISQTIILEFDRLFNEFVMRDNCFSHAAAARLGTICTGISRRADRSPGLPDKQEARIYHSLSYIHKNYNQDIAVEDLANVEHLSVSRYRALFKSITGLSPLDYLTVLRINHARQLIMQTDMSMGEIAFSSGYPDQLYFSRIFKKRTGFSPSAYKRSYCGD